MKDALGKDIQVGETYGYSQNSNGITHIKIGECIKINTKTVTLKVSYYKVAVYEGDPKEPSYPMLRDTISVKSNLLFPVDKTLLN